MNESKARDQSKTRAMDEERRRYRAAGAFHIASALVRVWGEDDPNSRRIAWIAVNIADAVMARLEETEPA